MIRLAILVSCVTVLVACGDGNDNRTFTSPTPPPAPSPPPPPPVPACQANNTASVRFGNRSASTTHTVFWNGLNVATLAPGQDSQPIVAAAGVAHRWEVRITNSNLLACAVAMPIAATCSTPLYTCGFP